MTKLYRDMVDEIKKSKIVKLKIGDEEFDIDPNSLDFYQPNNVVQESKFVKVISNNKVLLLNLSKIKYFQIE